MRKFVVVATCMRGIVSSREPLDDAGQLAANRQLDREEALASDVVVWRKQPPRDGWRERIKEPTPYVQRLMRAAERVA